MSNYFTNGETIRKAFSAGEITWADVLVITGLTPAEAYKLLWDLINPTVKDFTH